MIETSVASLNEALGDSLKLNRLSQRKEHIDSNEFSKKEFQRLLKEEVLEKERVREHQITENELLNTVVKHEDYTALVAQQGEQNMAGEEQQNPFIESSHNGLLPSRATTGHKASLDTFAKNVNELVVNYKLQLNNSQNSQHVISNTVSGQQVTTAKTQSPYIMAPISLGQFVVDQQHIDVFNDNFRDTKPMHKTNHVYSPVTLNSLITPHASSNRTTPTASTSVNKASFNQLRTLVAKASSQENLRAGNTQAIMPSFSTEAVKFQSSNITAILLDGKLKLYIRDYRVEADELVGLASELSELLSIEKSVSRLLINGIDYTRELASWK
jgi:hypothetical protein